MKKFFILLLALVLIFPTFSACKKTKQESFYGYFGTEIKIVVNDVKKTKKFNNFISDVEKLLSKVNSSSTLNNGDLKSINDLPINTPLSVSKTTYEMLVKCKELYAFTDNKFNPALYPLTTLWNFGVDTYKGVDGIYELPSESDINALLQTTDFNHLKLSFESENYYVTKTDDIKIDLGGMAKGYVGDLLIDLFNEYGYNDCYATLGSSTIVSKGEQTISIRNPLSNNVGDTIIKVKVNDTSCISTSGDYERYYFIDGKKYCHIIDNNTGKPSETGALSVTVLGKNSTICDALSTALFTMEKTTAFNFIKNKLTDYQVFLVYNDNVIYTNSSSYQLTNDNFSIQNI